MTMSAYSVLALSFSVYLAQACGHTLSPSTTEPARSGSPPNALQPEGGWRTSLDREHPLVGRIWDCQRRAYTDTEAVWQRMRGARIRLLGEKHDNPDHHRLQAAALRAIVAGGRRPAVAFEMFDSSQQPSIDAYCADPSAAADGLAAATNWGSMGWPPFELYLPIVLIVFENRLPIVAANIPPSRVRPLVREGTRALGPDLLGLELDREFPPALEASLENELRASHCGQLPDSMIGGMALAQHARDAYMARAALGADNGDGTVLVAGDGHVRLDRGIPYYLQRQKPRVSVASLAFVEVATGMTEPAAYAKPLGAADLPFDFVWFTPRADDADPCAPSRKKER
ncbi:MAG TPA: ChaN family lipoprotein [Polyangiaceae bacterium]